MSAGEQELIVRIDDLEGQLKEKEDFYKGVIMVVLSYYFLRLLY